MKLSRVICDNSDKIEDIQVYAMVLPDHEINPRVPCNSNLLPRIDLTRCQGIKTCILELEIFHIGIIISYARTKNIQIHSSYLLYLSYWLKFKLTGGEMPHLLALVSIDKVSSGNSQNPYTLFCSVLPCVPILNLIGS